MAGIRLPINILSALRENLGGIVVIALTVCASVLGVVLRMENSTPVLSAERISGTITTVLTQQPDAEAASSAGFGYKYGVRLLDAAALVFLDSERPRRMGSEVALVRQHHADGADTYRFLDE